MWSQVFDFMFLMGPFQIGIFCDSMDPFRELKPLLFEQCWEKAVCSDYFKKAQNSVHGVLQTGSTGYVYNFDVF